MWDVIVAESARRLDWKAGWNTVDGSPRGNTRANHRRRLHWQVEPVVAAAPPPSYSTLQRSSDATSRPPIPRGATGQPCPVLPRTAAASSSRLDEDSEFPSLQDACVPDKSKKSKYQNAKGPVVFQGRPERDHWSARSSRGGSAVDWSTDVAEIDAACAQVAEAKAGSATPPGPASSSVDAEPAPQARAGGFVVKAPPIGPPSGKRAAPVEPGSPQPAPRPRGAAMDERGLMLKAAPKDERCLMLKAAPSGPPSGEYAAPEARLKAKSAAGPYVGRKDPPSGAYSGNKAPPKGNAPSGPSSVPTTPTPPPAKSPPTHAVRHADREDDIAVELALAESLRDVDSPQSAPRPRGAATAEKGIAASSSRVEASAASAQPSPPPDAAAPAAPPAKAPSSSGKRPPPDLSHLHPPAKSAPPAQASPPGLDVKEFVATLKRYNDSVTEMLGDDRSLRKKSSDESSGPQPTSPVAPTGATPTSDITEMLGDDRPLRQKVGQSPSSGSQMPSSTAPRSRADAAERDRAEAAG